MSNHTPRVETSTTISVRLAIVVVASIAALTVLLVWLAIALFIKGDQTGDLLYTISGVIALLTAWPVAGTLLDIIKDWVEYRRK